MVSTVELMSRRLMVSWWVSESASSMPALDVFELCYLTLEQRQVLLAGFFVVREGVESSTYPGLCLPACVNLAFCLRRFL
jgi:hypothetical protein